MLTSIKKSVFQTGCTLLLPTTYGRSLLGSCDKSPGEDGDKGRPKLFWWGNSGTWDWQTVLFSLPLGVISPLRT